MGENILQELEKLQRMNRELETRVEQRTRELERSESRLHGILSNSKDAIIAIDAQQEILIFNKGAEDVFGYRADEIMGKPLSMLIPEKYRGGHSSHIKGFEHDTAEARMMHDRNVIFGLRKNGEAFPAEASITKIETRTERLSAVILQDISSRYKTEQALKESEQRFRQLAESIEEVFWVADVAESKVLYVSPQYEKVWGRNCQSLLDDSTTYSASIYSEDQLLVEQVFAQQRLGETTDIEYRIVRSDGEIRWVRDQAYPVYDEEGLLYRIVGVALDITNQKQLEMQLRQNQKMEAIGQLATGVAHNFNNMLMGILNNIELVRMEERAADNGPLKEAEGIVMRAAQMVKGLMAFSRSGQRPGFQAIDVLSTVRQAVGLYQVSLGKEIAIHCHITGEPLFIEGDENQLEQVIINLLSNADDAVRDGCNPSIWVEVNGCDISDIASLPVEHSGEYVCICIRDNGKGMDEETRSRIYEPFYTTKDVGEGTGLGLSSAFASVQNHGGWIECESRVNAGTTFYIYLPQAMNGHVPVAGESVADVAQK